MPAPAWRPHRDPEMVMSARRLRWHAGYTVTVAGVTGTLHRANLRGADVAATIETPGGVREVVVPAGEACAVDLESHPWLSDQPDREDQS